MALVGPRPERPEMVAELERLLPHYRRRHLVKPGVTGWAQVRCGYAGSTLGTAWKLCHDLYYLKHRSLVGDFMIMLETLAIAGIDSHRPLRVPPSQFLFGREIGLDVSAGRSGLAPRRPPSPTSCSVRAAWRSMIAAESTPAGSVPKALPQSPSRRVAQKASATAGSP